MKRYKLSKKSLALLLAVIMLFSTVSVAAVGIEDNYGILPISTHTHLPGNFVEVIKPTCHKTGLAISQCTVIGCDYEEEKILPVAPDSHTFGENVETKEATCLENGYEINICSECKECADCSSNTYTVVIPKTGHNFAEEDWIEIIEPIHNANFVISGKARNTCSVCGVTEFRTIEIPHEFEESDYNAVITKKPTCVSSGNKFKTCKLCKQAISLTMPIDPDAHVYGDSMHIVSEDYSCQQDGTGVEICEKCGYVNTVTVSKDKYHDYLPWVIRDKVPSSATCVNNEYGTKVKYCPIEKMDINTEFAYAEHRFAGSTTGYAATCSSEGEERGYCRVCQLSNQVNKLPVDPDNHKWLDEVVIRPATCTEKGTAIKRCQYNASHIERIILDKVDHVFETEWDVTEATCLKDGIKVNTCVNCKSEIEVKLLKDPDAHVFDETKKDNSRRVAPDCHNEGKEYVYCTECKKYIERSIPMHSDTLFEVESLRVPATCGSEGSMTLQCSGCSTSFTKTIEPDPDTHVPEKTYETIVEATCHSNGVKAKKCKNCKKVIESTKVDIEATGKHVVGDWVTTDGTCTEEGSKVRTCIYAGDDGCDFSETIRIAKSHNFTAWTYASNNYSCIYPTTRSRYCRNCSASETEAYYASHTPGQWQFDGTATCATGGNVKIICAVDGCDDVCRIIRNIPANAHVIDADGAYEVFDLKVDDRADKYCAGKIYKCKICGEPVYVLAEHNFVVLETDVKATCTEDGKTAKKFCADCRYVKESTTIPATGHDFIWGEKGTPVCSKCGDYEVEGGTCDHFCHNKGTIATVLTKVMTFFWKLLDKFSFGEPKNMYCKCGSLHYTVD